MMSAYQSTHSPWPTLGSPELVGSRSLSVGTTGVIDQYWARVSLIGIGHGAYTAFNWLFDNVLYVYVIFHLGMLQGGAVMTALSLVQCATTLVIYQRMGIDWVGVGFLQELQQKPNQTVVERLLVWVSRWPSPALFVALCMFQDPFVTTTYFRGGRFGPLARTDWAIFIAAVLASNLYWIFVASALGKLVATVWQLLSTWM
jgi:hypothetical protein